MQESLAHIRDFLDQFGAIDITATEDGFVFGTALIGDHSSPTQMLRARLTGLRADSLVLLPGLEDDEFARLIVLLTAKPPQDSAATFQSLLDAAQLHHVKSARFTYQRLSEDEAVVAKRSMAMPDVGPLTSESRAEIVAYLKGAGHADLMRLCDLSDSADQLASCVLEAAEPAPDAPDPSGREYAGAVVAGLQRACTNMMQSPVNRTQKGRQGVKRLLLQTESTIKQRLQVFADAEEAEAVLAEGVEELVEGLEIDGLVARYLKQKSLSDTTEARMLRQVRRAAKDESELDDLRAKLQEAGLSPDDWQNLLAKGPAAPRSDDAAAREAARERAARLRLLLTNMEQATTAAATPSAPPAVQAMAQMNQQVTAVVGDTLAKIGRLEQLLKHPEHSAEDRRDVQSAMRKLCELLAEIGQELRQPLTVISGTLGMLQRKQDAPGAPEDPMSGLVTLAAESSDQLDGLIGKIVQIAGFPEELNPDARILDALYNRPAEGS
jgi:signal transduction histidine kinase